MIAQAVLPYKYELEQKAAGLTALGGLPLYLDLASVLGLGGSIEQHVGVRDQGQGWTDWEMIGSLILLNLVGGNCVQDLDRLEEDEGFGRILRRVAGQGLSRQQRRALERRWRKDKKRGVPSASAAFRYLAEFHDPEQEKRRVAGKAIIPEANRHLRALPLVNRDLLGALQARRPEKTATLDMDATLVESHKEEALYTYKGFPGYQPLNTWWAEQEVLLHTEFRDGNVPAGYEQLRVLQEALEMLPVGVETVRMRSDTAGYQHDLLKYCEAGENERFGRIEFAISSDVTPEFKKAVAEVAEADWHPYYREEDGELVKTKQEWAEVSFVPNQIATSKQGLEYRYLAIREALPQLELPGLEKQRELPFPTLTVGRQNYKLFGIVTNMDWEGSRLIQWQHERCGKSEEAHKVMKEDLAGGTLPSGDFGENAAWWWIMVLSLNLNAIMKRLVLGGAWAPKRMKAIRFHLIHVPGRIIDHARELVVRLARRGSLPELVMQARRRIMELAAAGSG